MMVMLNGCEVDFDACAVLMAAEICEELTSAMAHCTEQEFLDAYVQRHAEKFGGEMFQI